MGARTFRYGWIGLVAIGALARGDEPLADARKLEIAFRRAIAEAEQSVACILVRRERERPADFSRKPSDLDDRNTPPDFFGSGVVIDSSGLILTNYHVVRRAGRILVRLPARAGDDGPREANAAVYAADARSDLAVLKVQGIGSLPALSLGSGENLV